MGDDKKLAIDTENRELDLSNTQLDAEKLASALDSMKETNPVEYTSFKHCGIGNEGCSQIANFLTDNYISVSALDLSCNNIWADGLPELCAWLSSSACTLVELYLQDNHLCDKGMEMLAEALKTNKTIKVLDLSQNSVSDVGVEKLAEVLATSNKSIELLGLANNRIGDIGAASLANMLGGIGINIYNEEVEEVEVEDEDAKKKKKMTPEEEAALAAEAAAREEKNKLIEYRLQVASMKNTSICSMNISSNNITHVGLSQLAEGVASHPEILSLVFEGNTAGKSEIFEFEDRAAMKKLANAVENNKKARVGKVKSTVFLGLHPRVGARSPLNTLLLSSEYIVSEGKPDADECAEASVLNDVWDYLGPV